MGTVPDHEGTDVVRLEEPLVRIDGDTVREIQAGDAAGVPGGESGRAAIRGVHVEPQALARRQVRQLRDEVHGARVGGARDGGDGDRPQAGRPVARDGRGHGFGVQAEAIVGGQHDQRLGREAQLVQRPRDREVRLVAGVDAHALQRRAARRPVQPREPPQVDVPDERHRDEVRHHAARGQQAEAALAVAREVAQPADDLLLHERAHRPGVPDVDALVGPLGENLADDGRDEGRRGEVRERPRVVAVQGVRGDAGAELVEDGLERLRFGGGTPRAAGLAEVEVAGAPRSRWACPSRGPSPRRRASPVTHATWPRRRARGLGGRDPRRGGR